MAKIIVPLLVVFLSINSLHSQQLVEKTEDISQTEELILNWIPTYDEALEKSKREKKPILIYFTGSDWCAPCQVLDKELFHTQKFKAMSDDSMILLEVDIPRRQDIISQEKLSENLYLQKKFKVHSFPTLLFINHRGRKIAEKKGYVITEYYYPFFQEVINKY